MSRSTRPAPKRRVMIRPVTRRTFLRRAGQAALALPLLQLPRGAGAQGSQEHPRRLIVFYQPNGTKKELWSPDGPSETEWTLGPLLRPLQPFADRLVLFDGIDMTVAGQGPGGPHQRGMASLLTGEIITEGDFVGGDGRRAGWAGGPSLDQVLAREMRPGTTFDTLELGVRCKEAVPRGRLVYRDREQPVPPIDDPMVAFERLFGGTRNGGDDPRTTERLLHKRRSVLDAVSGDFARLYARVTPEDRRKLEQHATSLRNLENRLEAIASIPACQPDAPLGFDDPMAEGDFDQIAKAQIDLLVSALACDLTRYSSLQCSTSVNALRFTFEGLDRHQGHSLSHAGDGNMQMQPHWERHLMWYSELLAYLLAALRSVPEGDGTLLDNTLVLAVNEISRGNTHSHADMPFILAGGAGKLVTGRHLVYDGASHNDLLVSLMNLLGLETDSFGHPDYCTGPLTGLA